MQITMTTPAIFFPTVSLLMVAYTNRYLALARRIRELHKEYRDIRSAGLGEQIRVLRLRVKLIRLMQMLGISALLLCVFCVLLLFSDLVVAAQITFAGSLLLLIGSLSVSLYEVTLTARALDIALEDMAEDLAETKPD